MSPEAQRRLQAARLWIAANRHYYSKAAFSCPVIPAAPPARIGIDERWRIYANSEHLESLTVEAAAAELIHVLNHALRDHAQRARNAHVVDAATSPAWNGGGGLRDQRRPAGGRPARRQRGCCPRTSTWTTTPPPSTTTRQLLDNAIAVDVNAECGSGCHSCHLDHELGADPEALSDLDRELLKRTVAAAVADHHKTHGPGSIPQGLARWAEQTLCPKVDWRQQLASALRSSAHHKTGTADYTWQRPSRRQQPQDLVLRPAMTRPVPSITVVVDTSASMSDHELEPSPHRDQRHRRDPSFPATASGSSPVDTVVHTDQQIHSANQIRLSGAGGTDMAAGIAAAAEAKPDAIVVITDGWTPWPPTRPPGARSVVAALTDDRGIRQVPDWIQAIDMSERFDARS